MTPALAALARRFRLPSLPRNEALPLALLLLALSSVFVFGNDRGHFYRASHHDWLSVRTLTLAGNLSAEHGFLGFIRLKLDEDGERRYVEPYNRFPIGIYALVKLAIQPAGDDLARQVHAARLLMLAFFAGAAAFAHLALARLLGDRRIALAATLLAFSSYYLLHYGDMIASEVPSLFGVMLVFHGMTLFAQESRFRQLLPKTAVALLLGWHAAALVAPFVLLGLGGELLRARRAGGGGPLRTIAHAARSRSAVRYAGYGAFSALVCALVVGFNFANEYRAFGGEVPLTGLPSFRSMLERAGNDATGFGPVGWPEFLRGQLGGVGGMAIPYAAADLLGLDLTQPHYRPWPPNPWFAVPGAAVLAACLAGLRLLPHRALFATLLLAGWCWAAAFRGSAALHEFEAMFHLGHPLALWSLALLGLRRLAGRERAACALPALALAAAAAFAFSAALMGRVGHGAEAAQRQRETAEDFTAIRPLAHGRSIVADPIDNALITRKHRRNYWLTGSYLQIEPIGSEREWREVPAYDFVVLPAGFEGSLTPDNARFHLYRLADLPAVRASYAAREPEARAAFDVHLDGRSLVYVRDPCDGADGGERFFVHLYPADARDLDADSAPRGFHDASFAFSERGARFDGTCMAAFPLPDYGIDRLVTGQYDASGRLWEAELALGGASE